MAKRPVLIVKFRNLPSQSALTERLADLIGGELEEAKPLFPGEETPDLGSLFEVKLKSAGRAARVLKNLEVEADIEYAHEPAGRDPAVD